jgi:hypothetical protein
MGLSREQAFEVIRKEREYQDRVWPRDNHPLVEQYRYTAPHLLMLEDYYSEARGKWRKSIDETEVLRAIAKMATIAFRALTEVVLSRGPVTYNRPNAEERLSEEEARRLISEARDRQDREHPRTKDNAGQYRFTAPHVYLLGRYLGRIGDGRWYTGNRQGVFDGLVEVAAICVRAMEEIEGPDLLFIGLRD